MDTELDSSVTIIGLGLMGHALASALLQAGHRVTVWNRTESKADALVAAGAVLAPSITDALQAGSLVVICVTDYQAVRELLSASDARLDGQLWINLTSGDSTQARESAQWAEQRGVSYVDGAIMAIPSAIGTADAAILLSGPKTDVMAHQVTLGALGTITYLGEDHGLPALYDGAGLSMMWSVLNAWLHGVALLRTAGVDAATFTPFAQQMATGTAEWLAGYAEQIDGDSYPADDATLDTHVGSMDHLIEESEALGVNAELPRLFKALADRAITAGHGGAGYASLIEQFSKA